MRRILIVTNPADEHSLAVAEGLRRKGAVADLIFTPDLPRQLTMSIAHDDASSAPGLACSTLDEGALRPTAVWYRRPMVPMPSASLALDQCERSRAACGRLRDSFLSAVGPDAFWVNPFPQRTMANHKPFQHEAALAVGLSVPPTLYSNDQREIQDFLARHGEVVVKPFTQRGFWQDAGKQLVFYTSRLTPELLGDRELIAACPGIYQKLVEKAYELRLTIMGEQIFAARVLSQQSARGRLDWREGYADLQYEAAEIPPQVQAGCRAFMRRMGLHFGCLDVLVTPAEEYVFLEVNEMGQFLFIEQACGLPLLDAFCQFLIHARSDFTWEPSSAQLSLSGLAAALKERMGQAARDHVACPPWQSGVRQCDDGPGAADMAMRCHGASRPVMDLAGAPRACRCRHAPGARRAVHG